jgi:CheY-like chemotaxis protein
MSSKRQAPGRARAQAHAVAVAAAAAPARGRGARGQAPRCSASGRGRLSRRRPAEPPERRRAEARWAVPSYPTRLASAHRAHGRAAAFSSWTTPGSSRGSSQELEAKGFGSVRARREKAASIILKRQTRPDLILLDINMPKVDGAQFCRFVKKNDMFKAIKVIFCSGEEREKVKRLVAECGADGFILKDEFLGKWIVDNG